ncbi:MAG: hypothetical protein AAF533_20630 [Acidobacteriota bacterium]
MSLDRRNSFLLSFASFVLLTASSSSAQPVNLFRLAPDSFEGSSAGPQFIDCTESGLLAAPDQPAAHRLSMGEPGIDAPRGGHFLTLSTGRDVEGRVDTLTQGRLRQVIEVSRPSRLEIEYQFSTTDDRGFRDYHAILLDGRTLACGDTVSTGLVTIDDQLAVSGWRRLSERGVDTTLSVGTHVLEIIVGDGVDSSGESSLHVASISVEPILGDEPEPVVAGGVDPCQPAVPVDPCIPAPFSNTGEAAAPTGTLALWVFDDNRYCAAGPGFPCMGTVPGFPDPNPGDVLVDSTDCVFEMYVVADCGTEMHVPLNDVESGCIRVLDQDRQPVEFNVNNGVGFDENGGPGSEEFVCWNAEDCTGGPSLGDAGGPGERTIMDVSFIGEPSLCGVYTLQFKSWAGCYWQLFANCDGGNVERFNIYADACDAAAAVNPLPELVIEDVTVTPVDGCMVEACTTVRNIGCVTADPSVAELRLDDQVVDLVLGGFEAGESRIECRSFTLAPPESGQVSVAVTATADRDDDVIECTEIATASFCVPAVGGDVFTRNALVECNACRRQEFESLGLAEVVTNQLVGLEVSGSGPIVAFDSESPTCDDEDLATPGIGPGNALGRGKVLILDEGSECSPDDDQDGGLMVFDFTEPSRVESIGLLDFDEEGSEVRVFEASGAMTAYAVPVTLDNDWQSLVVDTDLVVRVEVELAGSGAVTDLTCGP